MEQHPLQSLISLIEFDKEVIKKEQALTQIHRALDDLGHEKTQLTQQQESSKHRLDEAQKEVREYERIMQELDSSEQEKRKLLDNVESQAAYEALKKEITFLKKAQYDHERQLVQRWKVLEGAQKAFDDRQLVTKTQCEVIEENIQKYTQQLTQLKKELDELYVQRTQKEQGVPQEWLVKYNVMRSHTSDPIVSVESESCGGCFAQLPPQDLLDLKRKRLIQCSSCYRFIYLPEILVNEEESSAMPEKENQ